MEVARTRVAASEPSIVGFHGIAGERTPERDSRTPRESRSTVTRTFSPTPADIKREWVVIDATDVVLGRLASHAAALLRGKHKPTFAPHMDMGDFVIVVNAEKIALTGQKLEKKLAYRHSGYPGGLTAQTYVEMLEKHPTRAVEKAIRGPRSRS
jgi:large subunit ribosomal protein L13